MRSGDEKRVRKRMRRRGSEMKLGLSRTSSDPPEGETRRC